MQVDETRVYPLNVAPPQPGRVVVYWMSRDQRAEDNWALLYASERAAMLGSGLVVVFCWNPHYPAATPRTFGFMLAGLAETSATLAGLGIPFVLLRGDPVAELMAFAESSNAGEVICDFDPLRHKQQMQRAVAAKLNIPVVEVDAHNSVPARWVSDKREAGARTLRPKITRALGRFLKPFPAVTPQSGSALRAAEVAASVAAGTHTAAVLAEALPAQTGDNPGTAAGLSRLRRFLASGLARYGDEANDPNADACSRLSPYLHFGQVAAQRVALETMAQPDGPGREKFLEQVIVRRELADNFCLYEPAYDRYEAAAPWARTTHDRHRADPRPTVYDADAFEQARTHDDLWNAAQMCLVNRGELHGYLRMYWAKKILEWSPSPEEALTLAVRLNDRYALDGRDPNGYTNIAWSILGVHDRPWPERPIYGMVRCMMRSGCERKFDVPAAIRFLERGIGEDEP